MKYSPKKIDVPVRAIYAALIIFSVIALSVTEGNLGVIFRSLSIITLSAALYLFIRYEMTTYTYILNERGTDFDFVINKSVGRRGNYVCYFYMSDCVFFEKRTKNTKKELREKYKGIGFYNFSQNIIKKCDYIIVCCTEGKYEAVFFEPNEEFAKLLADAKENAVPYSDDDDADEAEADESYNTSFENTNEGYEANVGEHTDESAEANVDENSPKDTDKDEIEAQGIEQE